MLMTAPYRAFALQAKLFRGFADPSRLAILEVLRQGPLSVGAIVAATGLSQSNVSNHLRCLSDCGLVLAEQQGRFVHYRLSDERIAELLELADELLAGVARRISECTDYKALSADSLSGPEEDRSMR